MTRFDIALLPGDGIGPEVLAEGVKVVRAAAVAAGGPDLVFESYDAGAGCYRRTGTALPEATFAAASAADAIFFGCSGLPDVTYPDGTEPGVEMGLKLRFGLDLYANVRPIRLHPGVRCPLAGYEPGDIDYVILRENIEGLYASRGGGTILRDQVATDTMVITREGTERIARKAYALAAARTGAPADGRSRVTCVDKANILRSFSFFRKVFNEVAAAHPEIEADYAYADAMTCWMVLQPGRYDVVVAENMFGDILTDLGAATVGGMGMSPSAEIGDRHGLFQGSHGSAPTLAGRNLANPVATILSGAMMLRWLGERAADAAALRAADAIDAAVTATLAAGTMTADVGGTTSTSGFGDAVAERVLRAG